MTIFGKKIPIVFALLIWLVLWEIIGQAKLLFLIPPFTEVLKAFWELLGSTKFHKAVLLSLRSFGIGLGFAVLVGVPLGILMGRIKVVDQLLSMWVNIFVSAPLSAVVPVLMVVLGIGETTVIVTVFLFSVWVITLDTQAGVKGINPSLIEMGRSFGASRFKQYTRIIFWAALPEILAGLRLGVIRAVRGVVVGQLLIAIMGLGALFELYSRNFLMDSFWALVIVVFLFAYALSELVSMLEHRIEFYAGTRA